MCQETRTKRYLPDEAYVYFKKGLRMSDGKQPRKRNRAANALIRQILHTESAWLRQAKADLLRRDPIDAVNDVEALLDFANENLATIFALQKP